MRRFVFKILLILLSIGSICTIAFGYSNWGLLWEKQKVKQAVKQAFSEGSFGAGNIGIQAKAIRDLPEKGGEASVNIVTATGMDRNSEARDILAQGGVGDKGSLVINTTVSKIYRAILSQGSLGGKGNIGRTGMGKVIIALEGKGGTGAGYSTMVAVNNPVHLLGRGADGGKGNLTFSTLGTLAFVGKGGTGGIGVVASHGGSGMTSKVISLSGYGSYGNKGTIVASTQGVNSRNLTGQGGAGALGSLVFTGQNRISPTLIGQGGTGGIPGSLTPILGVEVLGLREGGAGGNATLVATGGNNGISSSITAISGYGSSGNKGTLTATGGTGISYIVQDTFTGTDNTALASHTGEIGATWTRVTTAGTGTAKIVGNRVSMDVDTASTLYRASGTPNANVKVKADFYVSGTIPTGALAGIIARAPSSDYRDGYLLRWTLASGQWSIARYSGGAATQIGTTYTQSLSIGSTYNVELRVNGSTIDGYIDGVLRVSATDTTWPDAGVSGFRLYHGTTTGGILIDNFTVENL